MMLLFEPYAWLLSLGSSGSLISYPLLLINLTLTYSSLGIILAFTFGVFWYRLNGVRLSNLGTELFPFPFLLFLDLLCVLLLPYLEHSLLLGLPLPVLRLLLIFTWPRVPSRFSPIGLSCISLGYVLPFLGTHHQNMQDILFVGGEGGGASHAISLGSY